MAIALWTIAGSTSFAHPGHPIEVVDPQSPSHYLLQPEHGFASLVLAAVIGWFFVRSLTTRRVMA
jgi:hypothetical protein